MWPRFSNVFSRKFIGWAARPNIHRELVMDAILMAVCRRKPKKTIIHSDQGSQYSSDYFSQPTFDLVSLAIQFEVQVIEQKSDTVFGAGGNTLSR